MKAGPWSAAEERKLREIYADHHQWDTAKIMGRTINSVKNHAHKLQLKTRKWWLPEDINRLRELYPHTPSIEIARILGVSLKRVYAMAKKLGLRKSEAYMASPNACRLRRGDNVGAGFRFLPGHVPANKGLRRPGYSIGRGRMGETAFKKGQRPRNYLPIGTVRPNGDGYLRIKVSEKSCGKGALDKAWEFVHVRVWEAAHGPVPKGHRLWWKDGNHMNCALENLELLSDAEHMARTTIHSKPQALKEAIYGLIQVKRYITMKEKKDGKKQAQRFTESPVRDARSA